MRSVQIGKDDTKMNDAYINEPVRKTPIYANTDIVVAGGGLSGVMAAVAAARSGARVLLCERYASLGGVATMGLPLQGYFGGNGDQIVKGLAEEFRLRLVNRGGADQQFTHCDMHNAYLPVAPEIVKLVCQEMLTAANVDILLSAPVSDVVMDQNKITAVIIEGKSGRQAVLAKQFIDCTGDADLIVRSGADYDMAAPENLQASTLNFILGNVDTKSIRSAVQLDPERYSLYPLLNQDQFLHNRHYIVVGLESLMKEAAKQEKYRSLWHNLCYITLPNNGCVCVNTVHVAGKNPCKTDDLSQIEIEGRSQAFVVLEFLREYIPGFSDAFMISSGPWAGIRESRIIRGLKTITLQDIKQGLKPQDSIALGGYPFDFHGTSSENGLTLFKVPVYGIPYGCLVPRNISNILVAGRSISATREAMASTRVMAQCMAEGEAAGIASAKCAQINLAPANIDVDWLRTELINRGAIV